MASPARPAAIRTSGSTSKRRVLAVQHAPPEAPVLASRSGRFSRTLRSVWISGCPPCGRSPTARTASVRGSIAPRHRRHAENRVVHAAAYSSGDAGPAPALLRVTSKRMRRSSAARRASCTRRKARIDDRAVERIDWQGRRHGHSLSAAVMVSRRVHTTQSSRTSRRYPLQMQIRKRVDARRQRPRLHRRAAVLSTFPRSGAVVTSTSTRSSTTRVRYVDGQVHTNGWKTSGRCSSAPSRARMSRSNRSTCSAILDEQAFRFNERDGTPTADRFQQHDRWHRRPPRHLQATDRRRAVGEPLALRRGKRRNEEVLTLGFRAALLGIERGLFFVCLHTLRPLRTWARSKEHPLIPSRKRRILSTEPSAFCLHNTRFIACVSSAD